jgi:hypothetical protein
VPHLQRPAERWSSVHSACQVLRIAYPGKWAPSYKTGNLAHPGHLAGQIFLKNQCHLTMQKAETKARKPLAETDKKKIFSRPRKVSLPARIV